MNKYQDTVRVVTGMHPDLFGGETPIIQDVPAKQGHFMSVEVSWSEIERTNHSRTYIVNTDDPQVAENVAKARAEREMEDSFYDEVEGPEVQSVDVEDPEMIESGAEFLGPDGTKHEFVIGAHLVPEKS